MSDTPTSVRTAPGTLSRRLLLAALVWIAVALLGAGLLLSGLFRAHVERRLDTQLGDHLEELVAATDITPDGVATLGWRPADPRFSLPLTGWYWQIDSGSDTPVAASGSLAGTRLPLPALGTATAATLSLTGPDTGTLRARVQLIAFPGAAGPLRFVVTGPLSDIEHDIAAFTRPLALTLLALGLSLAAAVVLQVRFGLLPLKRLGRALEDVRRGTAPRLAGAWPHEVAPLATELNAVLDQHATRLTRARTEAADLAHALKTPISVLRNELEHVHGERGRLLREQLARIADRIERHLSRARAAGSASLTGASTPVAPLVEEMRFGVGRLYAARALTMDVTVQPPTLVFRGDAEDLAEMLGNLLDNACKWARTRTSLRVTAEGDGLLLRVEDDGPGIPATDRDKVLRRGKRLDESMPGSGLGLAITEELAVLHGGGMTLGESTLGGLLVELRLPAAHAT